MITPGDSPDPDLIAESLEALWLPYTPPRQGQRRSIFAPIGLDAYWHLAVEYDLGKVRLARDKQKVFLARYARQDLHGWDDVEVSELRKWCELVGELIKQENPIQGGLEQDR